MQRRDHTLIDDQGGRVALQLLWIWIFLVVLYFAWEAASYRGVFAIVSEWEFDRLGQDLPTFNFTMLTLLVAWPALTLIGRFRERRLRAADEREAGDGPSFSLDDAAGIDADAMTQLAAEQKNRHNNLLALIWARDYMHFLFAFATALCLAAMVVLAWAQTLPDDLDHPRLYTPAGLFRQHPVEGAARLEGTLRYGRISSFGRGILFARRTALYAPLVPPEGSDGLVHYFVEFLPAERPDIHSGGLINHRDGVLVRADLPGALIRLYRYLGYRPAPDYHVLYVSPFTLRWPYYIIVGQFLLGALTFFASAFWQRYHLRRLSREVTRIAAYGSRPEGMIKPKRKPARRVWWD